MSAVCPFCILLQAPESDSTFIADFDHSVAFLNYEQDAYLGQSLLILKDHHEHLHLTPLSLQKAIAEDLTNLTTAILKAFGGFRANHQSLGNQVAHMHWHITPRYPNDLNAGHAPGYNSPSVKLADNAYRDLANRIRKELN